MARQGDQPIANRIPDRPLEQQRLFALSPVARTRIAAKRPLNSGPLPSRHVATPSGARSARTESAARHRQARRLSSGGRTGVVVRTAAA